METLRPNVVSGSTHISFYCDDINQTVKELTQRGVVFTSGIVDQGYGLVTTFRVPGNFDVELYQPHYTKGAAT